MLDEDGAIQNAFRAAGALGMVSEAELAAVFGAS